MEITSVLVSGAGGGSQGLSHAQGGNPVSGRKACSSKEDRRSIRTMNLTSEATNSEGDCLLVVTSKIMAQNGKSGLFSQKKFSGSSKAPEIFLYSSATKAVPGFQKFCGNPVLVCQRDEQDPRSTSEQRGSGSSRMSFPLGSFVRLQDQAKRFQAVWDQKFWGRYSGNNAFTTSV